MKNLKLFSAISALLISAIPAVNASSERGYDGFERRVNPRPSSIAVERGDDAYRVNVNSNSGRELHLSYTGRDGASQQIRVGTDGNIYMLSAGTWVPVTIQPAHPSPSPRMVRTAPTSPTPTRPKSIPSASSPRNVSSLSSASRTTRATTGHVSAPTIPETVRYYPGISTTEEGRNAIRRDCKARPMDTSRFEYVAEVCDMLTRFARKNGIRGGWSTPGTLFEDVQRSAGSSPQSQIKYLIRKVETLASKLHDLEDYDKVLNILKDIDFLISRSSPLKKDVIKYVQKTLAY